MLLFIFSGCANTCERCGHDFHGDGIDYDFYGQTLKVCVLCAEKLELYKDQANAPVESSPEQTNTESAVESQQNEVSSEPSQSTVSSAPTQNTQSTVSSAPSQNTASSPAHQNTSSSPSVTDGSVGANN